MKKVITILFIIMLFITIIQFRSTYALYKTRITAEYQSLLGVWSVKVNNTDISSGSADMTFEITDDYLHFEESEFVYGNYIAPGSEGYFDILIDATNTDVSVRYDIEIPETAKIRVGEDIFELEQNIPIDILGVEDIFIKDEEIDTTTEHINYTNVEDRIVSGVIPLSVIEAGYNGKVRVHFKWSNEENNEFDTMLGNNQIGTSLGYTTGNNDVDLALIDSEEQPSFVLPVRLQLTQYMGETITP